MIDRIFNSRRKIAFAFAIAALLSLGACEKPGKVELPPFDLSKLPKRYETEGMSASALNYTPWYIHSWGFEGPEGSGVDGGGANMMPAKVDGRPASSGDMCCSNFPPVWQPDLKITVRWLVDKKQDGKTPGYWYKAENVQVPRYEKDAGGLWAVFLPGDQVRITVADGKRGDENDPDIRPSDSDPYVAHGVIDHEWNRLYRDGGDAQ